MFLHWPLYFTIKTNTMIEKIMDVINAQKALIEDLQRILEEKDKIIQLQKAIIKMDEEIQKQNESLILRICKN